MVTTTGNRAPRSIAATTSSGTGRPVADFPLSSTVVRKRMGPPRPAVAPGQGSARRRLATPQSSGAACPRTSGPPTGCVPRPSVSRRGGDVAVRDDEAGRTGVGGLDQHRRPGGAVRRELPEPGDRGPRGARAADPRPGLLERLLGLAVEATHGGALRGAAVDDRERHGGTPRGQGGLEHLVEHARGRCPARAATGGTGGRRGCGRRSRDGLRGLGTSWPASAARWAAAAATYSATHSGSAPGLPARGDVRQRQGRVRARRGDDRRSRGRPAGAEGPARARHPVDDQVADADAERHDRRLRDSCCRVRRPTATAWCAAGHRPPGRRPGRRRWPAGGCARGRGGPSPRRSGAARRGRSRGRPTREGTASGAPRSWVRDRPAGGVFLRAPTAVPPDGGGTRTGGCGEREATLAAGPDRPTPRRTPSADPRAASSPPSPPSCWSVARGVRGRGRSTRTAWPPSRRPRRSARPTPSRPRCSTPTSCRRGPPRPRATRAAAVRTDAAPRSRPPPSTPAPRSRPATGRSADDAVRQALAGELAAADTALAATGESATSLRAPRRAARRLRRRASSRRTTRGCRSRPPPLLRLRRPPAPPSRRSTPGKPATSAPSCGTTYSGPPFYTSPATAGGDGSNGKLPPEALLGDLLGRRPARHARTS